MAVGKLRADWQQTSSLLALIINVNRDQKKGRAIQPKDMMPPDLIDKQTKNEEPDFYISPVELAQVLIKNNGGDSA